MKRALPFSGFSPEAKKRRIEESRSEVAGQGTQTENNAGKDNTNKNSVGFLTDPPLNTNPLPRPQ